MPRKKKRCRRNAAETDNANISDNKCRCVPILPRPVCLENVESNVKNTFEISASHENISRRKWECVRILPKSVRTHNVENTIDDTLEKSATHQKDCEGNICDTMRDVMSESRLEELENGQIFFPVSEDTKQYIYNRCSERLVGSQMMQHVCAVCDTWKNAESCFIRNSDEKLYERCRERLFASSNCPESVKRFYDVSDKIPELKHTLLSNHGVEKVNHVKEGYALRVCDKCYASLMKRKEKGGTEPPKFAIANGFDIGVLPKYLKDATISERRLTSLTSMKGHSIIARGGAHRSIRHHILVFSSQPDIIKRSLDGILKDEERLLIIFTNPMTPAQKRVSMKRFETRREKVNGLISFYLENNDLYRSTISEDEKMRLKNACSASQEELNDLHIVCDAEKSDISHEIDDEQSSIRRPMVFDLAKNEQEELFIQRDSSLFIDNQALEQTATLNIAKERVIDVQQSGRLLRMSSPHFFARLFPHLFPYGLGHPDYPRRVPVGFQECIKHYLFLSHRCFATDEIFPLVSFDIVSRKRAMSQISLTCRLNPKEIEELEDISPSDLAQEIEHEEKKRELMKSGCSISDNYKQNSSKLLLRRIQAVLGKSFATNEERKTYQRKAWNMANKFHSAAVFLTVTPNENGNATVAYFSGDISEQNLSAIKLNDIPGNSARIEIARKNPVACDLYFTKVLEILIEEMIGFDMTAKRPKKRGGLFGIPTAFMGGIESQGKGTLHVHLIVFLAGFPKKVNEILDKMRNDISFLQKVHSFHDSVVSCSAFESNTELYCPICGTKGSIEVLKYDTSAYMKNNHLPNQLSKCQVCSRTYGADDIIRNTMRKMKEDIIQWDNRICKSSSSTDFEKYKFQHRLDISDTESDSLVALRSAKPSIKGLPPIGASKSESAEHRVYMLELLLLNQQHRWQHAYSCFKKSSNSEKGHCRYSFPRHVHGNTSSDDAGRIIPRRSIGSEYINAFNDIVLQVIRSNHDVRFLLCCAFEIFYAIKYVVKDQKTVDNVAAVTLTAYSKKIEKEKRTVNTENRTASQKVYGRIASVAYARSEHIEVGAVTAVHYIFHSSTFVHSHEFQTLHLGKHLKELDEEPSDLSIIPHGRAYMAFNVTSNYKYRPPELEKISLYEFIEKYAISKQVPKNLESRDDFMRLHKNHPFFLTRTVRKLKCDVVPDIIGPRIPDLNARSEEDMEKYSKIALILFKPHRSAEDILGKHCTYNDSYQDFKLSSYYRSSQAQQILSNMQQYYVGRRMAQAMMEDSWSEKDVNCEQHSTESSSLNGSDRSENQENEAHDDANENNGRYICSSSIETILNKCIRIFEFHQKSKKINTVEKISRNAVKYAVGNTMLTLNNENTKDCMVLPWPATQNREFAKNNLRVNIKEVEKSYEEYKKKNYEVKENIYDSSCETLEPKTIVKLLKDAISCACGDSEANALCEKNKGRDMSYRTLAEISALFTLNEEQDVAYRIAGSFLLDSLKRSLALESPGKPLRMHLSGEGGTGKSRIINALRYTASSWKREDAIAIVAPTGIAAVMINGETVHSKLQLMNSRKPTYSEIKQWSRVHMLIWDEISMTGQNLFTRAFRKLRILLDTPPGEDIRLHIITAGDFAQLPPCFENYIFAAPSNNYQNSSTSLFIDEKKCPKQNCSPKPLDISGFVIWKTFTTVVKLTKNVRHKDDNTFGEILSRLRLGNHSRNDFEILNSRYIDLSPCEDDVNNEFESLRKQKKIFFPIAVQANISRQAINWLAVAEIARNSKSNNIPVLCVAKFDSSRRGRKPTRDETNELLSLKENQLQRLPPILPIFPGMQVNVTQNINPKLGLANGSSGVIVGSQFPTKTEFEKVTIYGVTMYIASELPEIVFVSVDQSTLKFPFSGIPKEYSTSVFPITQYKTSIRVNVLQNRKFTVQMTQIPLTPAFSSTTHKLQGITCEAILSYMFEDYGRKPTSLYVLVSRVKTLKGLFITKKLSEEDFMFFRPSKSVIEEEKRLEELSKQTRKEYFCGALHPDYVNRNGSARKIDQMTANILISTQSENFKVNKIEVVSKNQDFTMNIPFKQMKSKFSIIEEFCSVDSIFRFQRCLHASRSQRTRELCRSLSSLVQNVDHASSSWTVLDVPGDGNCWIYAVVVSLYYQSSYFGSTLCVEPNACRKLISNFLQRVSSIGAEIETELLKEMNLLNSGRGASFRALAISLGYENVLQMLGILLAIGDPYCCLWAGDIGEELYLLSTVLEKEIRVYSVSTASTENSEMRSLQSNEGVLKISSVYKPYKCCLHVSSHVTYAISIVHCNGNHFQGLIPPKIGKRTE